MSATVTAITSAPSAQRAARIQAISATFQGVQGYLNSVILERETHIELMLTCLGAEQHMAMIGLAGAAKSMLTDELCRCITDGTTHGAVRQFRKACHAMMRPGELLGGVDVPLLTSTGTEKHRTTGMMPEAHIVRLDEFFKAGETLQHLTLGVMNERVFQNGPDEVHCSLLSLFATSNELPTAPSLAPVWDRFLVRILADRVSEAGRPALLDGRRARKAALASVPAATCTLDDVYEFIALARDVEVPASIDKAVLKLWAGLTSENIDVSERRVMWSFDLLCAHAVLCGRDVVTEDDLSILEFVFWSNPKDAEKVVKHLNQCISKTVGEVRTIVDALHTVYTDWKKVQDDPSASRVAKSKATIEAQEKFENQSDTLKDLKNRAVGEASGVTQIERLLEKARVEMRAVIAVNAASAF